MSFRRFGFGFRTNTMGFRRLGLAFRTNTFGFRRFGLAFRLNMFGFRRFGFAFRTNTMGFRTNTMGFRLNMFGFRRFAVSGILPTLAMRRDDVIPFRQEWRFCHRVVERASCWPQDMPRRLLAGKPYVMNMPGVISTRAPRFRTKDARRCGQG